MKKKNSCPILVSGVFMLDLENSPMNNSWGNVPCKFTEHVFSVQFAQVISLEMQTQNVILFLLNLWAKNIFSIRSL